MGNELSSAGVLLQEAEHNREATGLDGATGHRHPAAPGLPAVAISKFTSNFRGSPAETDKLTLSSSDAKEAEMFLWS